VVMKPQFLVSFLAAAALLAVPTLASAQKREKREQKKDKDGGGGKDDKGAPPGDGKPKVMDFTGIDISGRLRTPQLLYFLDRAAEELDRASLERRSFIPEMVKSIDEEDL
jgi:hypothetical protein